MEFDEIQLGIIDLDSWWEIYIFCPKVTKDETVGCWLPKMILQQIAAQS